MTAKLGTPPGKAASVDGLDTKSVAPAAPTVTVLVRTVAAMTDDARARSVPLAEALTREWTDDAHFVAYEPRTVPVEDEDRRTVVRLLHEEHDDRPAVYDVLDVLDVPNVRMVALVGDIDAPGKKVTPEWRTDVRTRLEAAGLAYYETRGGFRALASIDYTIASRDEAAEWTDLYVGWCEYLESEHGLKLDRACKDWTRLYRLPNVKRGGRIERAVVVGEIREWAPHEHREPARSAKASSAKPRANASDDAALERAHALASRLPPSVEHHGGDEALMIASRELATVLAGDAEAIERVLVETFNVRCVPPWDAAKLRREAARAAERHAKQAADPLRKAIARMAERDASASAANTNASSDDDTPFRIGDVYAPLPVTPWLCEPLCVAPGAPTILAAYGGTGKTLLWQLFAICVATGRPFFGWSVRQGRVLWYDYEQGRTITQKRFQRLAAGLGAESSELAANLDVVCGPRLMLHTARPTRLDAETELAKRCDGYTLFVADSLRGSCPGLDENDSRMREPIDMLYRVSEATGCAASLIHHGRKSQPKEAGAINESMRGSSAINDAAQLVIMLEARPRGFRVAAGKVRDGQKFDSFTVEIKDVHVPRAPFPAMRLEIVDGAARESAELDAQRALDKETVLAYVAGQPGGMLRQGGEKAIEAALTGRVPRARVRDAVALLVSEGSLLKIRDGRENMFRAVP